MATKTDGTLWMWGNNHTGALGQNQPMPAGSRSSPVQVPGTTWPTSNENQFGYAQYKTSAAAIKTDGTLWTWGDNDHGQLGVNSRTYYSSPVQIPGTDWSKVSRGNLLTIALKSS